MKKTIKIVGIIVLVLYIILQSLVFLAPNFLRPQKADVIIILGFDDLRDEWSYERVNEGYRLYHEGYADMILVSGKQGKYDREAVGNAMKRALIEKGVKEEDILVDNIASNTYENIKYSKALMDEYDLKTAIIVSNDFHILRGYITAKKLIGEVSASSAYTKFEIKKMIYSIREIPALVKYSVMY